ncbi:MAG: hypothetical protein Fur005_02700 [Roseiflexaceae bacterium]
MFLYLEQSFRKRKQEGGISSGAAPPPPLGASRQLESERIALHNKQREHLLALVISGPKAYAHTEHKQTDSCGLSTLHGVDPS